MKLGPYLHHVPVAASTIRVVKYRPASAAPLIRHSEDSLKMSKGVHVWQRFDNHGEVSSLVVKAYTVSFLLLASVLAWTMGDALMHYGSYALDSAFTNNFTFVDFGDLNL